MHSAMFLNVYSAQLICNTASYSTKILQPHWRLVSSCYSWSSNLQYWCVNVSVCVWGREWDRHRADVWNTRRETTKLDRRKLEILLQTAFFVNKRVAARRGHTVVTTAFPETRVILLQRTRLLASIFETMNTIFSPCFVHTTIRRLKLSCQICKIYVKL